MGNTSYCTTIAIKRREKARVLVYDLDFAPDWIRKKRGQFGHRTKLLPAWCPEQRSYTSEQGQLFIARASAEAVRNGEWRRDDSNQTRAWIKTCTSLKGARDWNWGIAVGYLLIVMNVGLSLSLVYSYVPPVSNGPNLTCAFPGGSLTAPWLGVPWHLVLVQLHRVSHLQTDTRGRCWVAAQRVGETYQWLLYYWSHQHHWSAGKENIEVKKLN